MGPRAYLQPPMGAVGHRGWSAPRPARRVSARLRGERVIGAIAMAMGLATGLASPVARAQPAALPSPLSIEGAMALARGARPELDAATARADAADQRPSIVNVPDDPMVMLGLEHLPLPQPMGADGTLVVEQRFPLSDVLGARARSAEAEARRLRRDVERVALDVELEAAMAFLELHLARSYVAVIEDQIDLTAQLVAAAQARYAAAVGSQTEVLRAESELARLEAARHALDGRIEGAEGMLRATLGRQPTIAVPPLAPPNDDEALEPLSTAALIDRAIAARPELASGREAISRARSDVDVMQQMYFPMAFLRLGGAYTMAGGPGVMAMFGISIPVFRDRLDAGAAEARSMVSMSEAELEAMRIEIEGEVASAVGALRAARAQRDALREEVVPRARQTIDAALAQYGAAEVTQVTVIEALRALFAVELEALELEVSAAMAQARLRRALGRGASDE
jgi:cobalt-zinc-cadmium efflux system outer membrane protein